MAEDPNSLSHGDLESQVSQTEDLASPDLDILSRPTKATLQRVLVTAEKTGTLTYARMKRVLSDKMEEVMDVDGCSYDLSVLPDDVPIANDDGNLTNDSPLTLFECMLCVAVVLAKLQVERQKVYERQLATIEARLSNIQAASVAAVVEVTEPVPVSLSDIVWRGGKRAHEYWSGLEGLHDGVRLVLCFLLAIAWSCVIIDVAGAATRIRSTQKTEDATSTATTHLLQHQIDARRALLIATQQRIQSAVANVYPGTLDVPFQASSALQTAASRLAPIATRSLAASRVQTHDAFVSLYNTTAAQIFATLGVQVAMPPIPQRSITPSWPALVSDPRASFANLRAALKPKQVELDMWSVGYNSLLNDVVMVNEQGESSSSVCLLQAAANATCAETFIVAGYSQALQRVVSLATPTVIVSSICTTRDVLTGNACPTETVTTSIDPGNVNAETGLITFTVCIVAALALWAALYRLRRINDRRSQYSLTEHDRSQLDRFALHRVPPAIVSQHKTAPYLIRMENLVFISCDLAGSLAVAEASIPAYIRLVGYTFFAIDTVAKHFDVAKVRTIGDGVFLVGGLPTRDRDNPPDGGDEDVDEEPLNAAMAFCCVVQMLGSAYFRHFPTRHTDLKPLDAADTFFFLPLRIGVHSGSGLVGVVDTISSAPSWDCFGPNVGITRRLEELCPPGRILASQIMRRQIQSADRRRRFEFESAVKKLIKGNGTMSTSLVKSTKIRVGKALLEQLSADIAIRRRFFSNTGWRDQGVHEDESVTSHSIMGESVVSASDLGNDDDLRSAMSFGDASQNPGEPLPPNLLEHMGMA